MRVDTSMLWNDLNMLELRLRILDPVMDLFVINEATLDHSGKPKPMFFADNQSRFLAWKDKIRYVMVDDMPGEGASKWEREFHQRNAIMRGLAGCKAGDLVFLSDMDEIPDPDAVARNCYGGYHQVYSMYYANAIRLEENWTGTVSMWYFQCQQMGMQKVRENRYTLPRVSPGGWHFAYMVSTEQMHEKIRTFAHTEWDKPEIHAALEGRVSGLQDLFGVHKQPLKVVDVQTGYFPQYLKDNVAKYASVIAGL